MSSYDLLLWYANKLVEMNLGSIAIMDKEGEHYRRPFFSFLVCILGFKKGCRPLLFIDGTHLLGKYGGTTLGATGKDGNNRFFHVVFGIVDNKTDANWTWFISKLGDALHNDGDYEDITNFVSDRSKRLVNAIARVFPSSTPSFCLRYMEANFMKANIRLGKSLKEKCWFTIIQIPYASTTKEYDDSVNQLQFLSPDAHRWQL